MTFHTPFLVFFGISIISVAVAGTSQVLMLRAVHGELGEDKDRDELLRVVYVLFRVHRNLFPRCRLRVIGGVSNLLTLLPVFGLVLTLKLQHP